MNTCSLAHRGIYYTVTQSTSNRATLHFLPNLSYLPVSLAEIPRSPCGTMATLSRRNHAPVGGRRSGGQATVVETKLGNCTLPLRSLGLIGATLEQATDRGPAPSTTVETPRHKEARGPAGQTIYFWLPRIR
jgi:hypothetical protein